MSSPLSPRLAALALTAIVAWSLLATGWSASTGLDGGRFYDERFSFRNVARPLQTGSLHPQNGWYPSLSYLPQTALLAGAQLLQRATDQERFAVLEDDGAFTPLAYFLARLVSVLSGTGCLLLTFLIGRRLFSAEVALLGTVLLAGCPWFLRAFLVFKPDALLVCAGLLAFWWSLDAAEKPSSRRYLVAGIGIGLATAVKYNGALMCIPLVVAALRDTAHWRQRTKRLVLAGLATIAVFVLLNPYLLFYWRFFRRLMGIYSSSQGNTFAGMLLAEGKMLLHWSFHGWLVGAASLIGLAVLCVLALHRRGAGERSGALVLFLSVPLGYSLAYALVTNLPKGNNYLMILPFTSLAAAWLLDRVWERLSGFLPLAGRRALAGAGILALLVVVVWPANAFLYRGSVSETTLVAAGEEIRQVAPFLGQRHAVVESDVGVLIARARTSDSDRFVVVREVASLETQPVRLLDLSDFEVFPEKRLRGAERDFYYGRIIRMTSGHLRVVEPQWFKRRGSSQVVLVHPWHPAAPAVPIEWSQRSPRKGRFSAAMPDEVRPRQIISLEIVLPPGAPAPHALSVGDLDLEPVNYGWDEEGRRYMTLRFPAPRAETRLRLEFDQPWSDEQLPRVEVWHWSSEPPSRAGDTESASGSPRSG